MEETQQVKRRNTKLTKEQSQERLTEISKTIWEHIGQPAILFIKSGRDFVPYLVELVRNGSSVSAQYKCYAPDGSFRCYLRHYPNPASIMVGEQEIIYFDDGI